MNKLQLYARSCLDQALQGIGEFITEEKRLKVIAEFNGNEHIEVPFLIGYFDPDYDVDELDEWPDWKPIDNKLRDKIKHAAEHFVIQTALHLARERAKANDQPKSSD